VIVIHGALLVALHAQLFFVETDTLPMPPPAPKFWLDGEIENVQFGGGGGGGGGPAAAAWFTTTDCPAIAIVVERAAPLLAAAVNATDPLPLPAAPDVIAIQDAEDAAVQVHPA
jgi:hypothetical protein